MANDPPFEEIKRKWTGFGPSERQAITEALQLFVETRRREKPGYELLPVCLQLLGQLEWLQGTE